MWVVEIILWTQFLASAPPVVDERVYVYPVTKKQCIDEARDRNGKPRLKPPGALSAWVTAECVWRVKA